jgi:hypothetical protein
LSGAAGVQLRSAFASAKNRGRHHVPGPSLVKRHVEMNQSFRCWRGLLESVRLGSNLHHLNNKAKQSKDDLVISYTPYYTHQSTTRRACTLKILAGKHGSSYGPGHVATCYRPRQSLKHVLLHPRTKRLRGKRDQKPRLHP